MKHDKLTLSRCLHPAGYAAIGNGRWAAQSGRTIHFVTDWDGEQWTTKPALCGKRLGSRSAGWAKVSLPVNCPKCAKAKVIASAEAHPDFPKGDPFVGSAWRIGWEEGHGLRGKPLGIRAKFREYYLLGLSVAAQDKHNAQDQTREK